MMLEQAFAEAEECADAASDNISRLSIQGLRSWMDSPSAHVVFCGEFKRGKSSLVNALVGEAICPQDRLPATAVPAVLEFGERRASIHFTDGRVEPIEASGAALDALSVGSTRSSDDVQFVKVTLPSPFLEAGLAVIDTPGVNDLSEQRADVTYRFLPLCDAAVVVLDSTAPVTASETTFLKDRVFPEVLDRVIFVLGKCDRLDEEEREEALEGARQRLSAVTGSAVKVLLASTRLGPDYLDPIRGAVNEMVGSATQRRHADAAQKLRRILVQMLDDVRATIALNEESIDRQAALTELNGLGNDFADRYQVMRDYLDGFGRDTLKELISHSLKGLQSDIKDELRHEVEMGGGDVERFMSLQVPRRIEVRLKQWTERKGPEIETFLRKLVARVCEDFERMFLVQIDRASLPPSFAQPEIEIQRRDLARSRTQTFVTQNILPSAVAMGAGFLILGPLGIAAGAMAGQVAGMHLRERQADEKRTEALQAVDAMTVGVIGGFEAALSAEIDLWFDALEERLGQGFFDARNRAKQRLLTTSPSADLGRLEQRLMTTINQLEE